MTQAENSVETIARLIELHGEGGLAPTAQDWRAIFALGGAIPLLNLLKFRPKVATPEGPISGVEAYASYTAGVASAFGRVGAERLFFGPVAHSFGLGESPAWDAAILTRYPSAEALASMWLDPDFIAAHENREAGVERSQVLLFRTSERA